MKGVLTCLEIVFDEPLSSSAGEAFLDLLAPGVRARVSMCAAVELDRREAAIHGKVPQPDVVPLRWMQVFLRNLRRPQLLRRRERSEHSFHDTVKEQHVPASRPRWN